MDLKGKTRRIIFAVTLVTLLSALAFGVGLLNQTHFRYTMKRLQAKLKRNLAAWQGAQPRLVTLSGKLIGSASMAESLKGAEVLAVESVSGYAALSDNEGRFVLPHLMWHPAAVYTLVVRADAYHVKHLEVSAPPTYPQDGNIDVGECRVDENSDDESAWPVRYLTYDKANALYYRSLFDQITVGAETDHQKIDAVCKYVASKHNPEERRVSFSSARLILEGGAPHCSNLAFAMAAVTGGGGYPTRTVHTSDTPEYSKTHVAVEVYYGGGWHLYDPTYGVFFLNREKAVASHREIRLTPALISEEAFEGIKADSARSALRWMAKAYGSGFNQVYMLKSSDFAPWCR